MSDELSIVIDIAKGAGKILSRYFKQGVVAEYKQDEFDPVTQADKESDEYIRNALYASFPNDEILSEENDARPTSYSKRIWMVDPLDGTKDFINGRVSFCVMIGLLDKNVPRLGVVYNPVTEELLYALKDGGAFRVFDGKTSKLRVSKVFKLSDARLVTRNQVEGDVRPLDKQVSSLGVKRRIPEGSIGLKIGLIARGKADVFIHTNIHGCKWDTLAPQVILKESGGILVDLTGGSLDYTKGTVGWDKYFIAANNDNILEKVLSEVQLH